MAIKVKFFMCECGDPGCPVHDGRSECQKRAFQTLFRVDMEDETGTPMCAGCAEDAMEAGVFTDEPVNAND